MSVRKLNAYLHASPILDSLAVKAQRLLELQKVFNNIAPQSLANYCSVASFENHTLVIFTGNSAIAAKLKQQIPTVLAKFHKRGIEITSIRVEVQVRPRSTNLNKMKEIELSPGATQSLETLAESLNASPLKLAIEAMLQRHTEKKS